MKIPARLSLAVLALVAAAGAAATGNRFVPTDPDFVVANIGRTMPDRELRGLVSEWQADPTGEPATALATAFIERARTRREPMFMGRAEAVLAGAVRGGVATHDQTRMYAETLQFRHDFKAAEVLLDGVLAESPRDAAARILRASVRLVRGDFAGARGDCALLLARGDASALIGAGCLAEALAGSGEIERALALLQTYPPGGSDAARAYLLAVRGELRERSSDPEAAIADYASALALAPGDDSIRAALADALAARGDVLRARDVLSVDRPSLALVLRQALVAPDGERMRLRARAGAWLALEVARGDAAHGREAALLALAARDATRGLEAARANFASQRELADVRILARAAVAARSTESVRALREWIGTTGFADAVTETVLAGVAPR